MKNLLNCHTIGLHSFPISFENGLYRRIFYADVNHQMWKPIEIAIHPHHVDIKITILDGELFNPLYLIDDENGDEFKMFQWSSHIRDGVGGFKSMGNARLRQVSNNIYGKGDYTFMKACELHTVQIQKGQMCVWLIEEDIPTCEYFPINYSRRDLSKWTADGLYKEVGDDIKHQYIGKYI